MWSKFVFALPVLALLGTSAPHQPALAQAWQCRPPANLPRPTEGARGGARTHTALSGQGGLSPPRLPIPPPGQRGQATWRTCVGASPTTSGAAADHNAARTMSDSGGRSSFTTMTPSIMSARTAAMGRPLTATATTPPPGRRRTVRCTPTMRGGVRNPGAMRPKRPATAPRRLAALTKVALFIPRSATRTWCHRGVTRRP